MLRKNEIRESSPLPFQMLVSPVITRNTSNGNGSPVNRYDIVTLVNNNNNRRQKSVITNRTNQMLQIIKKKSNLTRRSLCCASLNTNRLTRKITTVGASIPSENDNSTAEQNSTTEAFINLYGNEHNRMKSAIYESGSRLTNSQRGNDFNFRPKLDEEDIEKHSKYFADDINTNDQLLVPNDFYDRRDCTSSIYSQPWGDHYVRQYERSPESFQLFEPICKASAPSVGDDDVQTASNSEDLFIRPFSNESISPKENYVFQKQNTSNFNIDEKWSPVYNPDNDREVPMYNDSSESCPLYEINYNTSVSNRMGKHDTKNFSPILPESNEELLEDELDSPELFKRPWEEIGDSNENIDWSQVDNDISGQYCQDLPSQGAWKMRQSGVNFCDEFYNNLNGQQNTWQTRTCDLQTWNPYESTPAPSEWEQYNLQKTTRNPDTEQTNIVNERQHHQPQNRARDSVTDQTDVSNEWQYHKPQKRAQDPVNDQTIVLNEWQYHKPQRRAEDPVNNQTNVPNEWQHHKSQKVVQNTVTDQTNIKRGKPLSIKVSQMSALKCKILVDSNWPNNSESRESTSCSMGSAICEISKDCTWEITEQLITPEVVQEFTNDMCLESDDNAQTKFENLSKELVKNQQAPIYSWSEYGQSYLNSDVNQSDASDAFQDNRCEIMQWENGRETDTKKTKVVQSKIHEYFPTSKNINEPEAYDSTMSSKSNIPFNKNQISIENTNNVFITNSLNWHKNKSDETTISHSSNVTQCNTTGRSSNTSQRKLSLMPVKGWPKNNQNVTDHSLKKQSTVQEKIDREVSQQRLSSPDFGISVAEEISKNQSRKRKRKKLKPIVCVLDEKGNITYTDTISLDDSSM